jgi:phenylalanyl-tRNA synthetase beta subunit
MVFSYNWLKEYLEVKREKGKGKSFPSPEEVAKVLNEKAFEVESVEKQGDDYLLDIDVLPNRAHDCLCHTGIAKEIAINFDLKFKYPLAEDKGADFDTDFSAEITDDRCLRYMLREVRNVEVGPSPKELQEKMEILGEKSINNVVDITNIILFELNQPMHAFDKDKLDGKTISARTSKEGEEMTTLDGNPVQFDNDTCVIADEKSPVAIAGIKGGNKAEVMEGTSNLILESANFSAPKIRQSSQKIDIATESSKRYENGITPELTEIAMNRATELLLKYGGDKVEVSNVVDIYPRQASPYYTGVSVEEVNRLLGLELSEKEISKTLDKLGFEYKYLNTKEFVLKEIKKHLGKPHNTFPSLTYDAPRSFDCTTLTAYVYAHGGKSIPRLTIDQLFFGNEITEEELQPGDLIFSNREEGEVRYDTVSFLPGLKFEEGVDHVGMYMGDDGVIHTSRYKGGVVEEKLSECENFKKIVGYRRFVDKDEMRFAIRVPDIRLDLRNEADIIEEIGRIYGYEKIQPKPIEGLEKVQNSNREASAIMKIKSELQKIGFSEVQTYSFVEEGDLRAVKALASDKQYLRTSISQSFEKTLEKADYFKDLLGIDNAKVFEIGKVYPKGEEQLHLAIALNSKKKVKAKAIEDLNNTLKELGIDEKLKENDNSLEFDLSKYIEKIDVKDEIKIDFDHETKFKNLSSYPFVARDISVWIPDGKGNEETIYEIVEKHADELLRKKRLLDVYPKDGRTSYAVRVVFQSQEKTLTDEEVGEIMEKVYKDLEAKEGFEIR